MNILKEKAIELVLKMVTKKGIKSEIKNLDIDTEIKGIKVNIKCDSIVISTKEDE
jgi:hypothetical protein